MTEVISLKEYQRYGDISENDLIKINKFLQKNKLDFAFKITPHTIETSSWIGVLKHKNIQLEVLPKLLSSSKYDNKLTLSNLLFMLSYTHNLNIKTTNMASLNKSSNPFLEILIREYAVSLLEGLKKQTPKSYIRNEDNLHFVKGKLNINQQIRYNISNGTKFFCEYDEFSEDNILNQLFNYVSKCLYNISEDNYNKKILGLIRNYYSDISDVSISLAKASKITLFRNQKIFEKPLSLAKMFLEHSSIDMSQNKIQNIALLWDMNQLFEEFVFEVIARKSIIKDINVTYQKGRKLLRNGTFKQRNTFVDIFIERGKEKEKIVVDTKYKLLEDLNSVSNADVFQVSTYCLLHDANKAVLIYPQWNEKINISHCFLNTSDSAKQYAINFKTINLQKDLREYLYEVEAELFDAIDFM